MSTVVARLEAILSANTAQFESAMTRSESRMQKVGHVAGVAGLAIAGGLAIGLEKSVKAAANAQVETARLGVAFQTAGLNVNKYKGAIDAAETSSRNLGFSNEDVRHSLGSLIIATHSVHGAMKDLSVAEDLSRFSGKSLADSSKTLTMAMAGSQRAVKQLGITVPAVTTHYDALKRSGADLTTVLGRQREAHAKLQDKMATSAAVIAAVTEKTKGQAKAFADTAQGGLAQMHAQFGALEENMGKALLPALVAVSTILVKFTGYLAAHTTTAKIATVAVGALGAVFLLTAGYAKLMGSALVTKVLPALAKTTAGQWLLNVAMDANPIGVIIIALAALGVAFYLAYTKIKFFRDGVNAAWSWIKDHWPLLLGILTGPIGLAVEQIIAHKDTLIRIFKELPGQLADAFTAGYKIVKGAIVGLFGKVIDWVKGALGISSPSTVFYEIGKNSILGFINGVGSMAGVLEHAVVHMAESALSHLNPFGGKGGPGGAKGVGTGPRGGHYPAGNNSSFEGFSHLQGQVVEALRYARKSGWHGQVTSGYRSYAEQEKLYQLYLRGGPLAAKPGSSSHEAGAAVDVTDYGSFGRIMRHAPAFEKLFNRLGAADPVHFSISGYDKGGWLPTGVSLAVNNTGSPERVVGPGGGGDTVIVQVGPEEVARVVFDQLRGRAQVFQRRNGYPAFGG